MPLTELGRLAALVREGPVNESERLALLAADRHRIDRQIHALEQAPEVVAWKTDVYEQHLRADGAVGLWDPTAGTTQH